jgi:anti-sigma B factor antagonist
MQRGTIELRRDGAAAIFVLRGEHDIDTAPRLRAELERALADGGPVLVDLSQTRFIDSTVLGALIYGHERRQPFALVVPPGCPAHRLCEIVELGGIVPTFPSHADALSDLSGSGRAPRGVSETGGARP